jgi:hypothetical protein
MRAARREANMSCVARYVVANPVAARTAPPIAAAALAYGFESTNQPTRALETVNGLKETATFQDVPALNEWERRLVFQASDEKRSVLKGLFRK